MSEDLRAAARLIGLDFADEQLAQIAAGVERNRASYGALRERDVGNDVLPALTFTPLAPSTPPKAVAAWDGALPAARRGEDLLWADIPTLASLVRTRQVSCVELAELSLARLEKLDPRLRCVVTLTAERALAQARERDAELARGHVRGPLHGIPWGAKDLLAVRGYPTTWGATPYRDQVLDRDATVVRKLDDAGAVLVAKLSLGELAMGDVWFGGRTNNPWNLEQGSSGSSAGSASAVAAGCVPFAIGSETLGSILSPSAVCGCSSLRPTFGAVETHGAMSLAPSMDKLGPICRSLRDAAIVFEAIATRPFSVPADTDVRGWRVGYLERPFKKATELRSVLDELGSLGVELVPLSLPEAPAQALMVVLSAESASSFDDLTRSGRDAELVGQSENSWPTSFRTARLIPAVEYIRANRIRTLLMREMDEVFADLDAYVHPALTSYNLVVTNLTGHPAAVAPCGFSGDGTPLAAGFTGPVDGESRLLALAHAWQRSTAYHHRHPAL